MNDRLYRCRHDRVIAGVAGGLAERLGADPSLIRIVWVVLMPVTGFLALAVYIVMALVVPEEPDYAAWPAQTGGYAGYPGYPAGYASPTATPPPSDPSATGEPAAAATPLAPPAFVPPPPARPYQSMPRRHERSPGAAGVVLGSILLLVGVWLLVAQFYPSLNFDVIWPLFIVGIGIVLLVAAVGRGSTDSKTP
jgi:phage shock protein PspC (stress-responsive transcriptional regulator)